MFLVEMSCREQHGQLSLRQRRQRRRLLQLSSPGLMGFLCLAILVWRPPLMLFLTLLEIRRGVIYLAPNYGVMPFASTVAS